MEWTEKVVKGCRVSNSALEMEYDNVLQNGRQQLEVPKRETNQEPTMLLKGAQSRRLTPKQIAIATELREKLSQAIIQGLHKDNQEIFGEDYLNQKEKQS